MKNKIVEMLATGFYLGKIPFAPGTFGTLLGIPLTWGLVQGGPLFYMFGSILFLFFAVGVAELHEQNVGDHDMSEIVIDEVIGYVVTMTWLPQTWQAYVAAFLAFRFFDILKPWPVKTIDAKVPGGFGTVLDDVAAGLMANVILQVIFFQTTWLGATYMGARLG